jgi:phosphoribosylformimino-5-aminoimidazole carboxamide ribotide isomerase
MSEHFVVYPAIDLRQGQVVRLMQGDPKRQTTYGNDPAEVARRWISQGASWLHVVNLDGAFGESGAQNILALEAILEETSNSQRRVDVQFGGGLRNLEDLERVITAGVSRAMVGSAAVEDMGLLDFALERYGPERIGLAMDVYKGAVRIHGWTESARIYPIKLGLRLRQRGMRICAYTDIQQDGSEGGLNLDATRRFAQGTGLEVIASGGVGTLSDVRLARQVGLSGVIIGRALYEGKFDLKEALSC